MLTRSGAHTFVPKKHTHAQILVNSNKNIPLREAQILAQSYSNVENLLNSSTCSSHYFTEILKPF